MMMARREPPSLRLLHVGQHVEEEKKLAVADARQAWSETARDAPRSCSATHGVLVPLPVLAVGRIGDQVIEGAAGDGGRSRACFRKRCSRRRGRPSIS